MNHPNDTSASVEGAVATLGSPRAVTPDTDGVSLGAPAAVVRSPLGSLEARLLTIGLVGAVAVALACWSAATSSVLEEPAIAAVFYGAIIGAYLVVGLYTWWHRRDSRLGPLIIGAAAAYALVALASRPDPIVHTLGMVAWSVSVVYTALLYLSFPRGRLASELDRRLMVGFVMVTGLLWLLILPLSDRAPAGGALVNCGSHCPANGLQLVSGHPVIGTGAVAVFELVFVVAPLAIAMLIFQRARSASYFRRRTTMPLAVVALANIIGFVVTLVLLAAYPGSGPALAIVAGGLRVAIPVALLVGQVRGDMLTARSLGRVAVDASGRPQTPAGVERLLGDALDDTTLRLALWSVERDGYVDVDGADVTLPERSAERAVTYFTKDGGPVAALIHEPSLDTDSEVVEGLTATSLMLLENTRLVQELQASRARIVTTAQRERLRLERNLHDGAQQRLMAVQVRLRMARQHAGPELASELDAIEHDAAVAVDDLRALAQGIYPSALRDLGIARALQSLAINGPIPIEVRDHGIGRCDGAVEQAIYFCALEALQNAGKHAGRSARVTIELARDEHAVHVLIADDGVGMDLRSAGGGVGLVSMRDRIGAVGGTIEISSSPGRGVAIRATVPVSDTGGGSVGSP
jgi:signal transduction histidine kinase